MRRAEAFLPFGLAFLAVMLSPLTGALAQNLRQGPAEIEKCQTINDPGSYRLVNNLTATGDCLVINTDNVTLDLAGFQINGNGSGTAIQFTGSSSEVPMHGMAVRNGTISGFHTAIAGGRGAILEGLRIFGMPGATTGTFGISAQNAILRGNTIVCGSGEATGITTENGTVTNNVIFGCKNGIDAGSGIVSGNDVRFGTGTGIRIEGGIVIGNTVEGDGVGISVACPSNVTDNWANGKPGIVLEGTRCNDTNNVNITH